MLISFFFAFSSKSSAFSHSETIIASYQASSIAFFNSETLTLSGLYLIVAVPFAKSVSALFTASNATRALFTTPAQCGDHIQITFISISERNKSIVV
jgi:hypothetical protein